MRRTVVIVDDHPVLRDGLAMMIGIEPDLELVGQAESCAQALALLRTVAPDLAMIDVSMKDGDGIELAAKLRAEHPGLAVLVVSAFEEARHAERALRAGARGYVMKSAPRAELLRAIRAALAGEYYLSPAVSPLVLGSMLDPAQAQASPDMLLSERELEIFALIGKGEPTDAIARQLFVSPKTIRAHRNNIMKKLGIKGSIQLYQSSFKWVSEHSAA